MQLTSYNVYLGDTSANLLEMERITTSALINI